MENEIDLYKSYLDYTKQLSGGQAQRLSIARGLARDFDIR